MSDRPNPALMRDALSHVLASVRLSGTVYFHGAFHAPWGVAIPDRARAPFYYVTGGGMVLSADGAAHRLTLEPGDIVFLPRGVAHALLSGPNVSPMPFTTFLARYPMDERGGVTIGGDGPMTSVIGGFFEFAGRGETLLEGLPPVLHARGDHPATAGWLTATIALVAEEMRQDAQGRSVVLGRLAEILLIQVLLAHLAEAAETIGPSWLRGLTHPGIARALLGLHRAPTEQWSLSRLAAEARMSRTDLALKFRTLVGVAPGAYLTRLRMNEAADLLGCGMRPLARVAERVGYSSELAFSKSFRRMFGQPPGAYRASRQAGGAG